MCPITRGLVKLMYRHSFPDRSLFFLRLFPVETTEQPKAFGYVRGHGYQVIRENLHSS